jgi:hypothetical protein
MKVERHDIEVGPDGTARLAVTLPRQSVKLIDVVLRRAP